MENVKSGTEVNAIRNSTGDVVGWTSHAAAVANGWFSRRNRSSDAFRKHQQERDKRLRAKLDRSTERQIQRQALTDSEQIARVHKRTRQVGNGLAVKEITRLVKKLEKELPDPMVGKKDMS